MYFKDPRILKIQAVEDMLGILKKGNPLSCYKKGDRSCRPIQQQALLQWAYNPFI